MRNFTLLLIWAAMLGMAVNEGQAPEHVREEQEYVSHSRNAGRLD